jgi:hypothetical protein
LFILTMLLVSPAFFPHLNCFREPDESFYINQGRLLAEGKGLIFAWSPLSSVLYAATFFPFRDFPLWMVYSCWTARLVLFFLIAGGCYALAGKMSRFARPFIVPLLLLMFPVFIPLFENGSDALFSAMSLLTLSQVVSFHATGKRRYIWTSSLCVSLAAFSRPEGIFLFLMFIPFVFLLGVARKRVVSTVAGWIVPFLVIFLVAAGGYRYFARHADTGLRARGYYTLEQGYADGMSPGTPVREGVREFRRLFGTAEENGYSVFRAVTRNPEAYFRRLFTVMRRLPGVFLWQYGGWAGLFLLICACAGAVRLARQKEYLLLGILLFWPSHLLLNILILYRQNHFLIPFFVVFLLAAVGLDSFLSGFLQRASAGRDAASLKAAGIALIAGITMFMASTVCNYRNRYQAGGSTGDTEAVFFMVRNFAPGTKITGIKAKKYILAAKMAAAGMIDNKTVEEPSGMEFFQWAVSRNVAAVYVNPPLQDNPGIWSFIRMNIGRCFRTVFTSTNGDIRILRIDPRVSPLDTASR